MSDGQRVLILGGGLAGLSFAIALATEAPTLDVTLLEAHPFPTPARYAKFMCPIAAILVAL